MNDTVDDVEQVREDSQFVISASNGFHRCVEQTGNGHSFDQVGFFELDRGKGRVEPRGDPAVSAGRTGPVEVADGHRGRCYLYSLQQEGVAG